MSIMSDEIKSFSKVAVLYGGSSSEREISLITGKAVFESLQSKGLEAVSYTHLTLPTNREV